MSKRTPSPNGYMSSIVLNLSCELVVYMDTRGEKILKTKCCISAMEFCFVTEVKLFIYFFNFRKGIWWCRGGRKALNHFHIKPENYWNAQLPIWEGSQELQTWPEWICWYGTYSCLISIFCVDFDLRYSVFVVFVLLEHFLTSTQQP